MALKKWSYTNHKENGVTKLLIHLNLKQHIASLFPPIFIGRYSKVYKKNLRSETWEVCSASLLAVCLSGFQNPSSSSSLSSSMQSYDWFEETTRLHSTLTQANSITSLKVQHLIFFIIWKTHQSKSPFSLFLYQFTL